MDEIEQKYHAYWEAFYAIEEARNNGQDTNVLEQVWREKKNEYLIVIGDEPIVYEDDIVEENEVV